MNLPHKKAPCKDCPFKTTAVKGWLGKERMEEILSGSSFVCHKDTSKQCAGHMLIKGESNEYVQLANRLGLDLEMVTREEGQVFESEQDCVDHHS